MTTVPRRSSEAWRRAAASLVVLALATAGPAAAQAPFTSLPDGHYIIEFASHRFALSPSSARGETSVNLCFQGEPDDPSSSEEWKRRTYWPFSRIVKDTEGFQRDVSEAVALYVLQNVPTTMVKTEAGEGPPAPVLAKEVRMSLSIDVSRPEDQSCYRYGEHGRRDSVADGPRRVFEWSEQNRRRVEKFGPLTALLGTENRDFAVGKIEAQNRGFPASHPLYIWCSWPDCRQFESSTDRNVLIQFSFRTASEGIDPSQWSMLDRYFHNLTRAVFLGHDPEGVD